MMVKKVPAAGHYLYPSENFLALVQHWKLRQLVTIDWLQEKEQSQRTLFQNPMHRGELPSGGGGGSSRSGNSCAGCGKQGSGFPGNSSHSNGTDAISLIGGGGANGLTCATGLGFQCLLGIPGFTSHRNGIDTCCLIRFLVEDWDKYSFCDIIKS